MAPATKPANNLPKRATQPESVQTRLWRGKHALATELGYEDKEAADAASTAMQLEREGHGVTVEHYKTVKQAGVCGHACAEALRAVVIHGATANQLRAARKSGVERNQFIAAVNALQNGASPKHVAQAVKLGVEKDVYPAAIALSRSNRAHGIIKAEVRAAGKQKIPPHSAINWSGLFAGLGIDLKLLEHH